MKKNILILLLVIFVFGCANVKQVEQAKDDSRQEARPKVLNIYNWENYLGETTISDFEKEFGIKVNLFIFDDENFMVSDVQSNPSKYDLIVSSDGIIKDMIGMKLLSKLDYNNLPNFKNIGKRFKNPYYDPAQEYTVPYLWGTSGIIFNSKFLPNDTSSWSVLWDEKYSGKIGMLNSKEEVITASLKYLGHSMETKEPSHLEEAKAALLRQKPLIKGYMDPVSVRKAMESEELWVAQTYVGSAFIAMGNNPNLRYIIPKEGAGMWADNWAIPADAENKESAELFLNYLLRPEVSASISNYQWYANPNIAAEEFIDPDILSDGTLYPSEEIMGRLETYETAFSEEMASEYNKIWSELSK